MRLKIILLVSSFIMILFCKPEPVIFTEADEHKYKHNKFHFDGTKFPIPGVTTESNLMEMFPEGPSTMLTFKKKINKKLFGRSFPIGKIYEYLNTVYELEEEGNRKSYIRKEKLVLVVFLDDGVVQDYIIDHLVRSENGEQEIGKFHHMPPGNWENDIWPGSREDAQCYWLQRPDRDNYVSSDELKCDRWAEKE